jgi:hypothetical protein
MIRHDEAQKKSEFKREPEDQIGLDRGIHKLHVDVVDSILASNILWVRFTKSHVNVTTRES